MKDRKQKEHVKKLTDLKQKEIDELNSKIKSLQQKLKDKENETENRECNVCYRSFNSNRRPMCFSNCGHTRTCNDCYSELQAARRNLCPACGMNIMRAQLAFM